MTIGRHQRSIGFFSLAITILLIWATRDGKAAQVPPAFINSVVAIGGLVPDVVAPDGKVLTKKWVTIGTGFFYGHLQKGDPDVSKRFYAVYLVTVKHVVDDWATIKSQSKDTSDLKIRVNPTALSSSATEFDLKKEIADPGSDWTVNPNKKDIAVIPVNFDMLRQKQYVSFFFLGDEMAADVPKLKELQVAAGDGVFVLGFPMGLSGALRNYVILRQGVVAKIDEMLDQAADYFMIDSLVFPGNSGGPVILKTDINAIQGTARQNKAYLIGVIRAYEPYTDIAVSSQTHRPRITFEENSGLTEALPIDYVNPTLPATGRSIGPHHLARDRTAQNWRNPRVRIKRRIKPRTIRALCRLGAPEWSGMLSRHHHRAS